MRFIHTLILIVVAFNMLLVTMAMTFKARDDVQGDFRAQADSLTTVLENTRDSLRLETARHDSLKAAVSMINYTKYPGPNDCFNGVVALAGMGLNPGYHAVGVAQYDSTYAAIKPYLNTIEVEWQ